MFWVVGYTMVNANPSFPGRGVRPLFKPLESDFSAAAFHVPHHNYHLPLTKGFAIAHISSRSKAVVSFFAP